MFWRQRQTALARATVVREFVDENLLPDDFQGTVVIVRIVKVPQFESVFCYQENRLGWYLWVKDAEQLPLLAQ